MRKTLGIIGGVGPLATMCIGELIVQRTKAEVDQQHLHTIIDNDPSIPDRTAYILNRQNESPIPTLQRNIKKLVSYGAEVLCIPCNTAHAFYDEMQSVSPVPILHMIRETAKRAASRGAKRVGILATDGTLASHVYECALQEVGVTAVLPNEEIQKHLMSIIYDYVKAGKAVSQSMWQPIEEAMIAKGCDCIILGCTELSIVNKQVKLSSLYVDSLVVLAEAAICACGYSLHDRTISATKDRFHT